MASPFQRRKAALAFYRWDQTKDGVVRLADLELWGKEVAAHLNVPQGSPHYDKILDTYRQTWQAVFKPLDRDNDDALTLDEYAESFGVFLDPQGTEQVIAGNRVLFDALDLDGDGRIGRHEYAAFVSPLGVTAQDARTAFTQLDRDGDGFIEREEFAQDLHDYFASDDRTAPANWFFGSS